MRDCRDKALDLVGLRPHFAGELEQKLADRGFPSDDIAAVVEELRQLGLVDDLRHARELASGSLSRKGYGPRRMQSELLRRGVEEDTVQRVVGEIFADPGEELRRAREFAAGRPLASRPERDRLARQLNRRGFSSAVIMRILDDDSTIGDL